MATFCGIFRYVKKTGLSDAWYQRSTTQSLLYRSSLVMHELIVHLSHYYKRLQKGQAEEEWRPPSSFARGTTK